MSGFGGRVVLITGATGIAASAARAVAAEGGSVFVASRSADHAASLARSITDAGGTAISQVTDVADEAAVADAFDRCVARFGRIDGVYHVAGISGRPFRDGPLHEMTLRGWDAVMATNATGAALVCRAAVRRMLEQHPDGGGSRGAILLMSSVLARSPSPNHFGTHAYTASKGAIEALVRAAAASYAPHGIRINGIAPALVATPMSGRAQRDPEILAYLAAKQPLAGGPMQPDDLVGTALYLLGDASRMVTGQVIAVDGGWSVSEPPTR